MAGPGAAGPAPPGPGPYPGGAPFAGAGGYPGAGGAPGDSAERRGSVRAAFGGLTTRGRSFVAAGGAAAVCAYLLGQPDLLRIGALLCLLPLLCVLVLHRTRARVTADRHLAPARLPAGAEARVRIRLENRVRGVPTGVLMLQDRVPLALGPRPRFVVDRVPSGGTRELSYRVRSEVRGRYPLGPLQLRLADPFGLVELERSFTAEDVLVVLPTVEPLPPVPLNGLGGRRGEGGRPSRAVTGDDDVIPRDYRHGDDMRRVHWRSTAHRGALMVRREEQARTERCTVLLDTRRHAWEAVGPHGFERAVSGAASAVAHLAARGYAVRLVTDTGAVLPEPGTGRADPTLVAELVTDGLAGVEQSGEAGFARAAEALAGGGTGLLVAFLGQVDAERAAELDRLRPRSGGAVAFAGAPGGPVLVDRVAPPGFGPPGAGFGPPGTGSGPPAGASGWPPGAVGSTAEHPRAPYGAPLGAGWTVLTWEPAVPLAQVWERAGDQLARRQHGTGGG